MLSRFVFKRCFSAERIKSLANEKRFGRVVAINKQLGCHRSVDPSAPKILSVCCLNPKHNIYSFSICFCIVMWKRIIKNNKEVGIGPHFKTNNPRSGALVQWLWEETDDPSVVSSNHSTTY